MLSSIGLIVLGLAILVGGGELLLRGAVGLATIARLTPAVIGLTVVAAGTSVPELAVSAIASFKGSSDIAIGNVVGSNIFNIAFILGLTALLQPLTIAGNTIKLEYPVMLIVTLLYLVLANDGQIGRLDAILFLGIYVSFTAFLIRLVRKELTQQEEAQVITEVSELTPSNSHQPKLSTTLGLTIGGVVLLAYGADITVEGAVAIGKLIGLSERVIGLTIVGAGTGLPEVVTSIVAALRGRRDVAIANVIGSNIFNILVILGLTSLILPINIPAQTISVDNWWLLGITTLLFPIMRSNFTISRNEGKFLLGIYALYLLLLIFTGN